MVVPLDGRRSELRSDLRVTDATHRQDKSTPQAVSFSDEERADLITAFSKTADMVELLLRQIDC